MLAKRRAVPRCSRTENAKTNLHFVTFFLRTPKDILPLYNPLRSHLRPSSLSGSRGYFWAFDYVLNDGLRNPSLRINFPVEIEKKEKNNTFKG